MELQVVLPDESPSLRPERIAELATTAERIGYRAAWLPDRLLPPGEYGTSYGGVYEPLVTLAYLAAHTTTIGLGTSVLVLPMRNPFVVAKQAATLDAITGGRLTLGVGIGWDAKEFAAVGADYRNRAARTDEAIALLRHLFGSSGPFDGEYYGYQTGVFEPRPNRQIPIMVSGTNDSALRRAARLADEWQAVGVNPAGFAERLARLRALTHRKVRPTVRVAWNGDQVGLGKAVQQTLAFAEAGATAVAVWFGGADGFDERMTRFAEQFS